MRLRRFLELWVGQDASQSARRVLLDLASGSLLARVFAPILEGDLLNILGGFDLSLD